MRLSAVIAGIISFMPLHSFVSDGKSLHIADSEKIISCSCQEQDVIQCIDDAQMSDRLEENVRGNIL